MAIFFLDAAFPNKNEQLFPPVDDFLHNSGLLDESGESGIHEKKKKTNDMALEKTESKTRKKNTNY